MPKLAKKPVKSKAKPAKKSPATLSPQTTPPDPGENRPAYVYVNRTAGVRVNENTALTLGAVFACVRVISESLAGLPWVVNKTRDDGGTDELRTHPMTWLLNTQASPEMPAFQFRETIIAHALTWGNGYAEIERDFAGRPLWLWLITPDRVTPLRDGGEIWYEVRNSTRETTYIPAEDMIHLRGLGFDGLVGYSVIQLAARSIGTGIALDQSTTEIFTNDSTPGGILTHPNRLSDQARKNLDESWARRHQGPANRRKVAILEEGLTWTQTGLPPEDTKLIEQRQFTPADICRWFRVPPHKIGDLSRATFSNIEHQSIEFVNDTLRPWAERLETEADIKLFGRTNRGTLVTVLNLDELKRGDMAAQAAFAREMLGWGVFSVNDARRFLNRNPIGADGEKRFVPMNMMLLEKAGDEVAPVKPAPPAEPAPPADTPAPQNTLRPVFEDACRRLLRTESERSKTAVRGGMEKTIGWFEKVKDDHGKYIRSHLRPVAGALALSMNRSPESLDAALAVVAEQHMEALKDRLIAAVNDPNAAEWESISADVAGHVMAQLISALGVIR